MSKDLQPNDLMEFAQPKQLREQTIVYKGKEIKLAGIPNGDDFFRIMFPKHTDKVLASSQNARINNRQHKSGKILPYDPDIYENVLAIEATYVPGEGQEPLSRQTIYAIYDSEPLLFQLLTNAALEVLGVMEVPRNSGQGAWLYVEQLCHELTKALKRQNPKEINEVRVRIKNATALALRDFKLDGGESLADDPDDLDELLENAAGNSLAAHSKEHAQT
jgi:hypothetical protein